MNDLRTAAQQALEALELVTDLTNHDDEIYGAIDALRAALAQEQAGPPGCDHCNHPLYAATRCRVCGRVTEQAEPVQEPVAWVCCTDRELPPGDAFSWAQTLTHTMPLYTAPPKLVPLTDEEIDRITDQQWGAANGQTVLYAAFRAYARAIERAHKIGDNK